ncbi:mariner-Tc1 transposon family protein [Penicillium nucicola]|uniref:mariner-Tc1 transposon family protein n=1 Tax=Penicillium nucicola TaxID=1850975 RepID=UPI00254568A9|nr:mariner-Tc1 transposon family protein [Penicillium nucicola]KAJ5751479.1 mariner-Tc1 transposon family protein [Penicillium nucicola]
MPRQAITNQQKIALREQHRKHPSATQTQLASWFNEVYNHRPTQSTLSAILSPKYRHLDTYLTEHSIKAKRCRTAKWPDLEAALVHWIVLTNGWLEAFQSRESIRNRLHAGEDGSTPESASEAMIPIRQALGAYHPRDIFNCDETALYWRRTPVRSLATKNLSGKKQQKSRITALFCCNSDGSEKLIPWFIGAARNPRAFTAAHININNFNLQWRSNKKAWMVGKFFEEWLRWFDSQMVHRKVVLLMDNFSAHESAVKTINNSLLPLQNTLIIWLPANSTSRFQPLDQGIIRTWKAYWKRQWVRFMVAEFDAGRDPLRSMNVLEALKWGIQAWQFDVSAQTIVNCFNKALTEKGEDYQLQQQLINELNAGLQMLRPVLDPMSIENFLNPMDEVVQDGIETIDDIVLAQFARDDDDTDADADAETIPETPLVPINDAIRALETLRLYEEQQERGETQLITSLYKHQRIIQDRRLNAQKQKDIRGYFCM